MNCREGQKAPRGTGEAKRVFHSEPSMTVELSETRLSLLG